jgi:hypothetical protein
MNKLTTIIGRPVMIRTYSAGVHYGILEEVNSASDGFDVFLSNSRRIYEWTGAFTLSELATKGSTEKKSKISVTIPGIALRAIEIIPMTDAGFQNLNAISDHQV